MRLLRGKTMNRLVKAGDEAPRKMGLEDAARILGTVLSQVKYTGQQSRDLFRQVAKAVVKNPALKAFFDATKGGAFGKPEIKAEIEKWRKANSFVAVQSLPVEIAHEYEAMATGKLAAGAVVVAGHPTDREWSAGKTVAVNPLLGTEYHDVNGVAWGWNGRSYINQGPTDKFIEQIKAGKYRLKLVDGSTKVTARPGVTKAAGTFDYEGADTGVQIVWNPPQLHVHVFSPLANIGKRGQTLDKLSYQLWYVKPRTQWGAELKRRLRSRPGLKNQEVQSIIRSTLQEAERESVTSQDKYPAKMYEPFRQQLRGSDASLPEPSRSERLEDRRGLDVTVKFEKPNVVIWSKQDREFAKARDVEMYLTVNWAFARKVSGIADQLIQLTGIEAVKELLDASKVKYKVHEHADPIWASVATADFAPIEKEPAARKKANDEIYKLITGKYFDGIPLRELAAILAKYGFSTESLEGIYTGREGKTHDQVGPKTWIVLHWYKMPGSGKYEITCYLS